MLRSGMVAGTSRPVKSLRRCAFSPSGSRSSGAIDHSRRTARAVLLAATLCLGLTACGSTAQNVGLGALLGATAFGSYSPNNEIEQTYYLGVFDPQEQLPPTVYRVRVHGQASFISRTKFASGWVPANVIDSLGTNLKFDKDSGRVSIEKDDGDLVALKTGRRLMLFGPEGFREAPPNHRLVIVMGSSPQEFFSAIDESLGIVAQATQGRVGPGMDRRLFEVLVAIKSERELIERLITATEKELPAEGVAR